MAQVVADRHDSDFFVYQIGRAAVAQVVDADAFDTCFFCAFGKISFYAGGRKRILGTEDEVLYLCVLKLPRAIALQLGKNRRRQVERAVARFVFWSVYLVGLSVLSDLVCDVLRNLYGAFLKINIIPG